MDSNRDYFSAILKTQYYSKKTCYDFPLLDIRPGVKLDNICVHHYFQRDSQKHDHNFLEIAYIAEGKVLHNINDHKTELQTGDYIFVNYKDIHQYKILSGETADIINCCFLPSVINPLMFSCRDFYELLEAYPLFFSRNMFNVLPTQHVFKDKDGTIKALFEEMIAEYNSSDINNVEIIRINLIKIILLSMRQIYKDTKSIKDNLVLNAIRYIENNLLSPDLSLNDLSVNLNISRQYISRRFKEVTGVTFLEYVQKLKINHCCHLLCTTDDPISEIAEKAGYNDIKNFYLNFKKQTGMTPSEFKKSMKM